MFKMTKLFSLILTLIALAGNAVAQNQYSAAIVVNDRVITGWELSQRAAMISAFGSQGDTQKIAQDQLINERLYLDAAQQLGQTVAPEEIDAGMEEFAARGNLTTQQIIQYLSTRGVAEQSFYDFVKAGILWRQVVRTRFSQEATISEDELDRTINATSGQTQESLLLTELIVPISERGEEATIEFLERLSRTATNPSAFSAAARRHSRAPSARRGGRLDWLPVSNLPPRIAAQVLTLNTNEVTGPIALNGAYAIFQLRGTRQEAATETANTTVTYATAKIGGRSPEAQKAATRVAISKSDRCLDLRAQAGEAAYNETSSNQAEVPTDIGMALAKLDPNEATYVVNADGSHSIVMLCNRIQELPEGARDELRSGLFSRKIATLGDGYLQELKGEAVIVYK